MAINKRKKTTAVAAGVTAAVLLLGGTFAWTSISQQAKNEAIVDINPGGRLHDDFNGSNKDVYVENFGDTTTGVTIYARVRLDEYFEVGQEAGKNKDTDMSERNVEAKIGTDINDVTTWVTYKPTEETLSNEISVSDYWTWYLGNNDSNMPYYMPTFNMNKDSLAADVNGTYEGTTEGDIVHYDDYKVYDADSKTIAEETHDWDEDTTEEDGVTVEWDNGGVTNDRNTPIDSADVLKETKEHTAEKISTTAEVITMAQWLAPEADGGKNGQPGNYWVYDTDGWAYWANPIAPGETTGLLLDGINMNKVPDDNWYYGINVVGQFATEGDIYQFEDMSPEAEELFAAVTKAESVVISGDDTVFPDSTTTYTAKRIIAGVTASSQPEFTWSAVDAEGNAIDGVSIDGGTLSVGENVADGTEIIITATSEDGTLTATKQVTVHTVEPLSVSISRNEQEIITQSGKTWYSVDVENAAGETIVIKLNRKIDWEATLAAEGNTDFEAAGIEVRLVEGTNDTLEITFSGGDIRGSSVDENEIFRETARIWIHTDVETVTVDMQVIMTLDDSLQLFYKRENAEATEVTADTVLQEGDVLTVMKDGISIGYYSDYFLDENGKQIGEYAPTGQLTETYYQIDSSNFSLQISDKITQEQTITFKVVNADGEIYCYKDFTVTIAAPVAETN